MRISDWSSDVCSSDLDDREILVDGPKFVLERFAGGARTIALPDGVTAWLIPVTGNGLADGVAFAAGECLTLTGTVQIAADAGADLLQIGRASCRERVCQYV